MSSTTGLTDDFMYGVNFQDIYGVHIHTSMYSSRMHTAHFPFDVSSGGSLSKIGGLCLNDLSQGRQLSREGSLSRVERDPSTVNRQTGAKTLPFPNFICGWK